MLYPHGRFKNLLSLICVSTLMAACTGNEFETAGTADIKSSVQDAQKNNLLSDSQKQKIKDREKIRVLQRRLMPLFNSGLPKANTKKIVPQSMKTASENRIRMASDQKKKNREEFYEKKHKMTKLPAPPKISPLGDVWDYESDLRIFSSYEYVNGMDSYFGGFYAPSDATAIAIYFNWVDLESFRDFAVISDADGNICEEVTGSKTEYTAVSCYGNEAHIWVQTDSSLDGLFYDGFEVGGFFYLEEEYVQYPPTAIAKASAYTIEEDDTVSFDGSDSYDLDGYYQSTDDLAFEWYFSDDGSTSSQIFPQHTFANPGTWEVTLTVYDSDGLWDQETLYITVNESLSWPSANFSLAASTVGKASKVVVKPTANTDSNSSNDGDFFVVTWGDSSTPQMVHKTDLADQGNQIQHQYEEAGDYDIVLTVTNSVGVATASQSVTIVNEDLYPLIWFSNETEMDNQQRQSYTVAPTTQLYDDGLITSFSLQWGGYNSSDDIHMSESDLAAYNGGFSTNSWEIPSEYTYTLNGKNIAGVFDLVATTQDDVGAQTSIAYRFETRNKAPKVNAKMGGKCVDLDCHLKLKRSKSGAMFSDTDGEVVNYSWRVLRKNKITGTRDVVPGCENLKTIVADCQMQAEGQHYAEITAYDNLGKSKTKVIKFKIESDKKITP